MYGTAITFFWNVIGIISPFFIDDFYFNFSKLDGIFYASDFYDGEASNQNTKVHPFVKKYTPVGTVFEYQGLILAFLIILGGKFCLDFYVIFHCYSIYIFFDSFTVAQVVFWFNVISFYFKLRTEETSDEKEFSQQKTI